jgi:lysine/ornithine N-monooxygenase
MASDVAVAIIGAGPFGLSLAAYLRHMRIEHAVFGTPMQSWISEMPKGMHLKSDGFASNLYDPRREFTLARYCTERRLPYADLGHAVPLDVFSQYGLAFQKRYVPGVHDAEVVDVRPERGSFVVQLAAGEIFVARKVIVATGVRHFRHMPDELAHLPTEHVSHSGEHRHVERFKGREVTVLGSGASAIDLAVLLHETGAKVRLVARGPAVYIHDKMRLPRSFRDRIREPGSGIGPGWKHRFLTDAPHLFRYFPQDLRFRIVRNYVGPSGGWFMKERFGPVRVDVGQTIAAAEMSGERVQLRLSCGDGTLHDVQADHVIAATGYKVDLRRLTFLDRRIHDALRTVAHTPVLSTHFESSVPGLYFMGPVSAHSFGPVMRFAFGAKFTSPRLAGHLGRVLRSRRIRAALPMPLAKPSA